MEKAQLAQSNLRGNAQVPKKQPAWASKYYKHCAGFCYENIITVTGGEHLLRTLLYPLPPGEKPRTVQLYCLPVQLSIIQVSILFTQVDRYPCEQPQPCLSLVNFGDVFKACRRFSDPKL